MSFSLLSACPLVGALSVVVTLALGVTVFFSVEDVDVVGVSVTLVLEAVVVAE